MTPRTFFLFASPLLVLAASTFAACSNTNNDADCTSVGAVCVAACAQGSLPYSCSGGQVCCEQATDSGSTASSSGSSSSGSSGASSTSSSTSSSSSSGASSGSGAETGSTTPVADAGAG